MPNKSKYIPKPNMPQQMIYIVEQNAQQMIKCSKNLIRYLVNNNMSDG